MNYNDWDKIYKKIIKDLGYKYQDDKIASDILNNILEKKEKKSNINKLENLIQRNDVIVFGAGPSLDKSIKNNYEFLIDKLKISADGATSALINNNMFPDIIVTDLDGRISDQINSNLNGSIVIIHAHGDNIEKLKNHVKDFDGHIIGTTQINPINFKNLYNFGGFTDGDRAVLLALHFKAKKIYLIGFDFNGKIGKYSYTNNKDLKQKIRKLKWCKYIIEKEVSKGNIVYIK